MSIPTPKQDFIDRLSYLYSRWQDEKEYEDINDYLKAMQIVMPTASKMTKRPFGVIYESGGTTFHAVIKSKGGGRAVIEISEVGGAK